MDRVGSAGPEPALAIPLRRGAVVRGLWILAGVNLLVVAASWWFDVYYRVTLRSDWEAGGPIKYLGVQFHLASENVLATWYSSALLFFAGAASTLGFVADRRLRGDRGALEYGWLALGALLLLLSADEVGSIHERVGMMPQLNLTGEGAAGWYRVLLVPIFAVLGFLAAFGLLRVRRSPRAFALLLAAIACYGVNPLLEADQMAQLERAPLSEEWFRHDVSLHIEEAAELFGALAFLAAAATYLTHALEERRRSVIGGEGEDARLEVPWRWWRNAVAVLLAAMTIAWWTVRWTGFDSLRADTGNPENWFPDALALLLAARLLAAARSLPAEDVEDRRGLLLASGFFWITAAYYGAYGKGWLAMPAFAGRHLQWSASAILFGCALACAAALFRIITTPRGRVAVAGWLLLLGLGLLLGPTHQVHFLEFAAPAILLIRSQAL